MTEAELNNRYDTFKAKYLNKVFRDVDGVAGIQCVDLVKAYVVEVLGESWRSVGYSGGALEVYNKFPNSLITTNNFTKIANTIDFVPKKGDIIVFGAMAGNPYGHIGVVDSADKRTVRVLNTNWGSKKATINSFNYTSPKCLGFLRYHTVAEAPKPTIDPKDARIGELTAQVADLNRQLIDKQHSLDEAIRLVNDHDSKDSRKINELNNTIATLTKLNSDRDDTIVELKNKINELNKPKKAIEYFALGVKSIMKGVNK